MRETELKHFGVKGMRWGQRMSAKVEARAAMARRHADAVEKYGLCRGNTKDRVTSLRIQAKVLDKTASGIKKVDAFTSNKENQKKLVAAGVVGAAVVGFAAHRLMKDPKFVNRVARATWSKKNEAAYQAKFQNHVARLAEIKSYTVRQGSGAHAQTMRLRNFNAAAQEYSDTLKAMGELAKTNPNLEKLNKGW